MRRGICSAVSLIYRQGTTKRSELPAGRFDGLIWSNANGHPYLVQIRSGAPSPLRKCSSPCCLGVAIQRMRLSGIAKD